MQDKRQKSDILLDAIGQLDDRFIFEASDPKPRHSVSSAFKRLAVLGISIALVFTVALTSIVGLLIARGGRDEKPDVQRPKPPYEDSVNTAEGLNDTFVALKSTTTHLSTDMETVDLFDGTARVIWKYSDEEDYRVCEISSSDAQRIGSELGTKQGFTAADPENADSDLDGVWICFGDGLVYSPCLKTSKGNVGFGSVFSYEPELEPSDEFIGLLSSAIGSDQ